MFNNQVDRVDWLTSDGRVISINDAGRAILGDAAVGCRSSAWGALWAPESADLIAEHLQLARNNGSTRFSAPSDMGGKRSWWDVVLSALPQGFVAQSRDISANKAIFDDYCFRSKHDGLTGLLNRAAIKDALGLAIERNAAAAKTGAVLMLDLDNFKLINDTLGHDIGDQTLQAVADGLRDVVGEHDCARLGGDEFAVILPEIADLHELRDLVETLLARLNQPVEIKGRTINPRASIGAALFPKHGNTAAELLKNSDIALYAAKSFGRGGYVLFVPSMAGPIRRRAAATAAVRAALAENNIDALYQPMIDFRSGRLLGFEAKLQVLTPGGRLLPESELAAVCEGVELAQALGERMLTKVTSDVKRWRDNGMAVARIAVNAYAAEFRAGSYAENFLALLERSGLPPELFELEVAETVFAGRGTDYVIAALKCLSAAGVRISLDDFGTGPASLSRLKRLPVNGIKIDGSFVEAVEHDAGDGAIVRAMIGLANGFGIGLAAEGVSTLGQARMLKSLGCNVGQGDLFGRAAPAAATAALFATQQFPVI